MAETPRSIALNLLGDYLRYAGGEAKLGELTELMTAFGLGPARVRVSMSRAVREQLRKQLVWTGFGQRSPATWLAPHDLSKEANEIASQHQSAGVDVLRAGSDDTEAARELAARCWDLLSLGRDYIDFLATYAHLDNERGNSAKDGKQALVERTRITDDFRSATPNCPTCCSP
jgi:DNA-binding transcriptional regulator PaaX